MAKTRTKRVPAPKSPVTPVSRKLKEATRILLAVAAGGRCEFSGCNDYLFEHPLTLRAGNFSENAHIVAFSRQGPRGRSGKRPKDVNSIANLMLLCQRCHKHIDDNPTDLSVKTLEAYKAEHERRIRHVTGLAPNMKTTVVELKAKIAGQNIDIPIDHVTEAVAPRWPTKKNSYKVDLTELEHDDDSFVATAEKNIASKCRRFYEDEVAAETRHISLFALAPIHLLIYLGTRLSNKIPVDFYQRHRDGTNPWVWKKEPGPAVSYALRKLQEGSEASKAAIVLSLSGTVHRSQLPPAIDAGYTIYEITLEGRTPAPDFLRRSEDLEGFRRCYRELLAQIRQAHPGATHLALFPAVPAPVAVACGYDLLPKVDPHLEVYDNDRARGGFTLRTTINPNDKQYD